MARLALVLEPWVCTIGNKCNEVNKTKKDMGDDGDSGLISAVGNSGFHTSCRQLPYSVCHLPFAIMWLDFAQLLNRLSVS
jgi:hypothetical protein